MKQVLSLCISVIFATLLANTQAKEPDSFDPLNASIAENIAHPEVPQKKAPQLASHVAELCTRLKNEDFHVKTVRDGQVALVTIPCSELFGPAKTELTEHGKNLLKKIKPLVSHQTEYKIIVAVHSDNTGDAQYADNLTADRANAIDAFFNTAESSVLIPYGLGADEPVASNQGTANRAKNRRVEIYFVPTQSMISTLPR